VKRYVAEEGSDDVARWLEESSAALCSIVGFAEVYRAITLARPADPSAAQDSFERDWRAISVIQAQEPIVRRAARLAVSLGLRTLDAIHLASAEAVRHPDLRLATWDRRLWVAASTLRVDVLPDTEP